MVVSYTAVILLGVFSQMASSQGTLRNRQIKPTSIENCENLNFTTGFYSNSTHQPIQFGKNLNVFFITFLYNDLFFSFFFFQGRSLLPVKDFLYLVYLDWRINCSCCGDYSQFDNWSAGSRPTRS